MTKPVVQDDVDTILDASSGSIRSFLNGKSQGQQQLQRSCIITKTHAESLSTDRLERSTRKAAKVKLSVQFGDIEVRSYPIILGDNPSVSGGPPLTIDWDPFDSVAWSLDDYQEERGDFRAYSEMKMPKASRFELLARTHSAREIVERTREVAQVRKDRYITTTQLYKAKNDEKMEKFVRGFMNLVTNKKKKEREFLRLGKEIGAAQDLERERNSMSMPGGV